MADKRKSIVDFLETKFKTIAIPTYNTDAGDNVFVWKSTAYEAAEMPALNIRDVKDTVLDELAATVGIWTHNLDLEIDFIANTIAMARSVIVDVTKALGVDTTCGGNAVMITMKENEIHTEQEDKIVAGGVIRFTILYRTNRFSET